MQVNFEVSKDWQKFFDKIKIWMKAFKILQLKSLFCVIEQKIDKECVEFNTIAHIERDDDHDDGN